MPHKDYRADQTHREIQAMFEKYLGGERGLKDGPEIARMHALNVNAIPLGDSKPRIAKSYSVHYSKEENESVSVARMLVQLDLDSTVENIIERDKPDIRVDFRDGTKIFVEVRLVESGQIRESRFLEDANHVLLSGLAKDDLLRNRLGLSNVTIALQTLPSASMHQLLKESKAFIRGIFSESASHERIPPLFPTLYIAEAHATWRPKGYEQVRILQKGAAWLDGDYVGNEAEDAIAEKMDLAKDYDPTCVPLWLLLGIVDVRPLPGTVSGVIRSVFDQYESARPYERLLATAAGMTIVSKVFE